MSLNWDLHRPLRMVRKFTTENIFWLACSKDMVIKLSQKKIYVYLANKIIQNTKRCSERHQVLISLKSLSVGHQRVKGRETIPNPPGRGLQRQHFRLLILATAAAGWTTCKELTQVEEDKHLLMPYNVYLCVLHKGLMIATRQ